MNLKSNLINVSGYRHCNWTGWTRLWIRSGLMKLKRWITWELHWPKTTFELDESRFFNDDTVRCCHMLTQTRYSFTDPQIERDWSRERQTDGQSNRVERERERDSQRNYSGGRKRTQWQPLVSNGRLRGGRKHRTGAPAAPQSFTSEFINMIIH